MVYLIDFVFYMLPQGRSQMGYIRWKGQHAVSGWFGCLDCEGPVATPLISQFTGIINVH